MAFVAAAVVDAEGAFETTMVPPMSTSEGGVELELPDSVAVAGLPRAPLRRFVSVTGLISGVGLPSAWPSALVPEVALVEFMVLAPGALVMPKMLVRPRMFVLPRMLVTRFTLLVGLDTAL